MAAINLGKFEGAGIGLTGENYKVLDQNFRFETFYWMTAISFFVFLLVGLYIDKVFPGQYGIPQPFHFFLLPSFWCPKKRKVASSKIGDFEEGADLNSKNYEELSSDVKQQEKDNTILKIKGLKK